jgi:glutaredoxin
VPKIVSGTSVTIGDNKKTIVSGLAEAYGTEVLMQKEADAMMGHFDEDGNPLVVLYGTDRCGYVKKAREYLNAQGVEFVDLNIDRSAEASANFIALEGSGTPLIYFGYRRIEGWSKPEIDRAIKELL